MTVLKGMPSPYGDAVPTWRGPDRACVHDCARLRHRAQRGQALILAIIALLVLCIGVIVVFNTGQATSKKVQLVNAADAAAYSAAVQQARAYNLIAYMNRASVANEVAVAQMASIYSYVNFYVSGTKELKDRLQDITDGLYLIGVIPGLEEAWAVAADFQQAANALGKAQDAIQKARDAMQQPFSVGVRLLSAINKAYSDVSYLVARGAGADAGLLARKVVELNTDGKATIGARGLVLLAQEAIAATSDAQRYSLKKSDPASEADRYANVVMDARDGFSRERNGDTLLGAIKKRGGTDIVTTRRSSHRYDAWVAADTLDFHINVPAWLGDDIELPLAWGAAAAVNRGAPGFKQVIMPGFGNGKGWTSPYEIDQGVFDDHKGPHYDRYSGAVDNHDAGKNVQNDPAVGGTGKAWLKGYQGLQDYNDIATDKATVPYVVDGESAAQAGVKALDAGPIFTVLVEQPMKTVRTSTHVPGIGGQDASSAFYVPDKAVADDMTALSSAQVYFDRPRGFGLFDSVTSPSSRELGNLFSPYWQARLVDTPCTVRQEVAIAYGAVAPCIPSNH